MWGLLLLQQHPYSRRNVIDTQCFFARLLGCILTLFGRFKERMVAATEPTL